jgi:hypothetical protein
LKKKLIRRRTVTRRVRRSSSKSNKKAISDKRKNFIKNKITSGKKSAWDGYDQVSNEYDSDYKKESKANGYNQVNMSNEYSVQEGKDLKSQLDGRALSMEIGADRLSSELNNRVVGAGFKDRGDLQDLLKSVKGADTFLNHTPLEQL